MHAFGIPIERFVPTEDDESVAVFNTTAGDKPSNETEWPCKLMTWSQEVVAIGRAHIGNGTQRIHCKALPEHAYKVTVDVINKGDVALPYPDGYHSTLGEVGNGSLVAWPKAFVTFTEKT
ncbi:hypothetical protein CKAN_02095200 [Cinnamomum micranthum f. kanehirae]|uniref:DUF8039 domain-containing protein n=1 Tax=Cinnamomum micranthum f. kanehirae TaxID=337451 RepID=A0A443PLY9_9MAGN|nr:hypothetical protein CKAN_02095200 [Cinnamomum micranthum f. kanehirae]